MKKIFWISIFLVVLAVGAKFYRAKMHVLPISILPCVNITQGCGNDMLTIRFAEAPQVMKPLNVNLHLNRPSNVRAVSIDFAMQNMEMGLNRYRLISDQKSDHWQAEVTLPVCVQGRSDWSMLIELETEDDVQRFQMPFSAKANRAN